MPNEVKHSLLLKFERVLTEAEWREIVELCSKLPYVKSLEARAE